MTRRAWHQCLMLWVVPAALCGCGPPNDDELDGGLWSTEIAAVPASSWLEPAREDTSPPEPAVPDAPGGPVASPEDEDGGADLWRPEERELLSSAEVPTLDLPLDDVVEEEGEDLGVESEPDPELAPEHGRALEEAGLHARDLPGVMIVERLPEFGEWETPEDEEDVTPRLATLVAGTAEGVELIEVVEVLEAHELELSGLAAPTCRW